MKLCAKSLQRIKMAPRTRIMKIGALLLSWFDLLLALNFKLFGIVTPYNDDGTETKPVSQPERRTFIERKYVLKLAEFMASLTALLWERTRAQLANPNGTHINLVFSFLV